jgi:PRC-barrel domain
MWVFGSPFSRLQRAWSPLNTSRPKAGTHGGWGFCHHVERRGILKGDRPMATTTTNKRETTNLIGSDKVEGTDVYSAGGESVGSIERIMIDKISGKVAYAVMSFGGFMGIGEDYYPVPWSQLTYDTNLGGYRTNITKEQLDRAPKYSESTGWNWSRENERRVYDYYRATPYWE